jgi:hypothetical protein
LVEETDGKCSGSRRLKDSRCGCEIVIVIVIQLFCDDMLLLMLLAVHLIHSPPLGYSSNALEQLTLVRLLSPFGVKS